MNFSLYVNKCFLEVNYLIKFTYRSNLKGMVSFVLIVFLLSFMICFVRPRSKMVDSTENSVTIMRDLSLGL